MTKTEELQRDLEFAKSKEALQIWFNKDCAPYIQKLEKQLTDIREVLDRK